jgi:hypothetical protein
MGPNGNAPRAAELFVSVEFGRRCRWVGTCDWRLCNTGLRLPWPQQLLELNRLAKPNRAFAC